jgi:hypothetical protein
MLITTQQKKSAALPLWTPGYLPSGSPEFVFNFCKQFFVMEGKIQELILVHERNRFKDKERLFPGGFTRIIYRDYGHGVITPYCNVPITRGIPEFLYNILSDHFQFHNSVSTATYSPYSIILLLCNLSFQRRPFNRWNDGEIWNPADLPGVAIPLDNSHFFRSHGKH